MPARVGEWHVIHVPRDSQLHSRMQSKHFKLLSRRIFPDGHLADAYAPFSLGRPADLSIWIDASFQINSPAFVSDMRAKLGAGDWTMFVHPDRDCIYEEATGSLTLRKYRGLPVNQQAEANRSLVPPHGGLFATGMIARREPLAERLKRVNDLWWAEKPRAGPTRTRSRCPSFSAASVDAILSRSRKTFGAINGSASCRTTAIAEMPCEDACRARAGGL